MHVLRDDGPDVGDMFQLFRRRRTQCVEIAEMRGQRLRRRLADLRDAERVNKTW
ncbi:hypothetical protein D3C83_256310 [compost metagenome]